LEASDDGFRPPMAGLKWQSHAANFRYESLMVRGQPFRIASMASKCEGPRRALSSKYRRMDIAPLRYAESQNEPRAASQQL